MELSRSREPLLNLVCCGIVCRHAFQLCRYKWHQSCHKQHGPLGSKRTSDAQSQFHLCWKWGSAGTRSYIQPYIKSPLSREKSIQSYFEMRPRGLKVAHRGRKSTGGYLWRSISIRSSRAPCFSFLFLSITHCALQFMPFSLYFEFMSMGERWHEIWILRF